MTTAPFRVTLWQASKPRQPHTIYVSGVTREGAVSVAQQWVCWTQEERPRGRIKFNRWKVELRDSENGWRTTDEGTLGDAKTEQPEEDSSTPEVGTIPFTKALARRRIGYQGSTRRNPGREDKSRLAQLVADMKTRK